MNELTPMQKRAKASARAKSRIARAHFAEYEKYYHEECAKYGLKNRLTKAQQIEKLKQHIDILRQKYGEDDGQ